MTYAGYYSDNFVGPSGGLQRSTPYDVYEMDGVTHSTLYSDRHKTTTVPNPSVTNELGEASFYVAPGLHIVDCNDGRVTVMVPSDPGDADGTGHFHTPYIGKLEPSGLRGQPTLYDPGAANWTEGASITMFAVSDGQVGATEFTYDNQGAFCSLTAGPLASDGTLVSGVTSYTQSDAVPHQWAEFYHVAQVDPWDGLLGNARVVIGIDGEFGDGYQTPLFMEARRDNAQMRVRGMLGQTSTVFQVDHASSAGFFTVSPFEGYIQVNGNGGGVDAGEITIYGNTNGLQDPNIDLGVRTASGVDAGFWGADGATLHIMTKGTTSGAMALGFFGVAPVPKPVGVAVTPAGIHAALVTLGLIGA